MKLRPQPCKWQLCLALLLFHSLPSQAAGTECDWAHGFHARDLDDSVQALAVWDDGTGEALYAGGEFGRAEDIAAGQVARWDGAQWWPLLGTSGSGLEDVHDFRAMVVWNGSLFVAGEFASADGTTVNNIARWDGTAWWPLTGTSGTGTNETISALAVWDDGTGEALYVGGNFSLAGGLSVDRIARWDGSEWSALPGGGLDGEVRTLQVWDDGSGEALYAGGEFEEARDLSLDVNYVARWDGSVWSALTGPSAIGLSHAAYDLTIWKGQLLAAGDFNQAGGVSASRVATWDGISWTPLSSDVFDGRIFATQVWNDGSGPRLYAAGDFRHIGTDAMGSIARWDGSTWTALPADGGDVGLDYYVRALVPFDAGDGEALILGGDFRTLGSAAGGAPAHSVARWDGTSVNALPGSTALGMNDHVYSMAIWDDGSGEALYAVGRFRGAGTLAAPILARWDGQGWAAVGSLGYPDATELAVWDGDLYVAGAFTTLAGMTMNNIARWDGTAFSPLVGSSGTGVDGRVRALEVWDDGTGEALYIGGTFTTAGGTAAANIAKWDGTDFSPLGSGTDDDVESLTWWDDGRFEHLYVGGTFSTAGGVAVSRIARWDGAAWSALTGPTGTGTNGGVFALTTWDGDLFLGGGFGNAGGVGTYRVARWDGTNFFPLVDGALNGVRGRVQALYGFDDGSGDALYLGVSITGGSSGVPVGAVGKWDGSGFTHLGIPSSPVWALHGYAGEAGGNPALFVGGNFSLAGATLSDYIAMRVCDLVTPTAPTTLDSPSHQVGVISTVLEIEVEWQGASDNGGAGLWGYSYVFDEVATTEPDDRIDRLHTGDVLSLTTDTLPFGRYYFHLKTCDRRLNCTTSHLGPFVLAGVDVFADGFESGDTTAWTVTVP